MRSLHRRSILKGGVGAMSSLFIRGLASGIPTSYLMNPSLANAQAPAQTPQTLILSTSSRGDPININCPGSYTNGVLNNPDLETAQSSFGGERHRAAKVWCDLPRALRQRLAFFHYRPRTAAHPEYSETMTLKGSMLGESGNGREMFASAMSQMAFDSGVHRQIEPVPLCDSFLSYKGHPLQLLKPTELKSLFGNSDQSLDQLRRTRDRVLDRLYADMKVSGSKAQRDFIDRYAKSQEQAKQIGDQLSGLLENIGTYDPDDPNSAEDQIIAAVALAELNVSPVITVNIPFGGDNHQDAGLVNERTQTISGVAAIESLWTKLNASGIQDRVTFATMNVFGRRHYLNQRGGRDHNRDHAVMVAFGSQVQGGVYGGMSSDGQAIAFDGIGADQTMEAAGVSLAHALGQDPREISRRIPNGRLVDRFIR